ncbi:uncharacterized protein FIESC28_10286 [Fusarium coffeatum]|uniref:Transcription factor domain-containing protein n=1 Tax=Fusarium coffeatum TaxID=231269 RepID=A0A366QWI1_9HYPO|nr:uncharacterized protein FIESC28_10286 [Fusarium coffeatum]RBR08340.1 hypothetical protein FIESC28_10286 [Fusarium coffeatum]
MADDSPGMAFSSPAADWGQLGGLSPPGQVEFKAGVLAFDGNPDFSESKVWAYVESFKEHILNMHPIIQPKLLDYWVRHFLYDLPASYPRSAKPQTSKPTFAVGGAIRNGAIPPSPNQGSPPGYSSHSHSSGLPFKERERNIHSRRSSIHGLEYFAYATDILGNHLGAYNNMKNVYANIFAELYHGQLGRPMESFALIHKASHKLQVIMRPSLDKLRRIKRNSEFIQETKHNQLALTFPTLTIMFYALEDPAKAGKDKFRNVEVISDAISGMHWVAPNFAFREDDPPTDDILAAKLRTKYWGAQFSHSIKNHASSPNFPSVSSGFRENVTAPMIHPKARTIGDVDPQVVELAKKGIKPLIESTGAFLGWGDRRPIITNIFGTAHA